MFESWPLATKNFKSYFNSEIPLFLPLLSSFRLIRNVKICLKNQFPVPNGLLREKCCTQNEKKRLVPSVVLRSRNPLKNIVMVCAIIILKLRRDCYIPTDVLNLKLASFQHFFPLFFSILADRKECFRNTF